MFLLLATAGTLGTALVLALDTNEYGAGVVGNLVIGVWLLSFLGLLVPMLAVQVRRLHDQDWSGWLVLLNLVPYLGGFVMLVIMLFAGTKGDNRYGPDPTVF